MELANPQSVLRSLTQTRALWIALLIILALIALVTALSPIERTLGGNARLVYFHGAWVWAGKLAFGAAAIAGCVGLLWRRQVWQRYALALGRAGLFFWITYLPLSLYVQQVNWGGIFWDEPRWRIPLMFGIVGVLLQVGLWLIGDLRLASAANLVFGVALWWSLGTIQNVLHPNSPITQSTAIDIQIFFAALLLLSLAFGAVLARLLYAVTAPRQ